MTAGADILVVDDEADIRELVAGILEDEGYSVRVAADSEAALAALRARRPSLLIQDICPVLVCEDPLFAEPQIAV